MNTRWMGSTVHTHLRPFSTCSSYHPIWLVEEPSA
jgi:hypothetical protein